MSVKDKIIKTCYKFNLAHIGSCMSCSTIIYKTLDQMDKDDEFILSKGHAGVAYYCAKVQNDEDRGVNILKKYGESITFQHGDWIPNMDILPEHPEMNPIWKVPCITGSLGHGLPVAVGMAYANPKRDVYVLLSDGELDEGSNYESTNLAIELKLNNLYIIVDRNDYQGYRKVPHKPFLYTGMWIENTTNGGFKSALAMAKTVKEKQPKYITVRTRKQIFPTEDSNLESHYKKLSIADYHKYIQRGGDK